MKPAQRQTPAIGHRLVVLSLTRLNSHGSFKNHTGVTVEGQPFAMSIGLLIGRLPMINVDKLLNEREKTHGKFSDGASVSQMLKQVARTSANWDKMNDSQRESFDMQASKWGRILTGDHNFADHWVDLAGYSTLGGTHSGTSLATVASDIRVSFSGMPKVTDVKIADIDEAILKKA